MGKPPYKDKPFGAFSALNSDEILKNLREAIGQGPSRTEDFVNFVPNIDIYSTPDSLFIEIEIPGVELKDIDISLVKNTMLVKGVKYESFDENEGNYICMESGYGRFYRSIEMPFPIDTREIKAVCKDGVLTIRAKRIDDKRGLPKQIKVESE